MAGQEAKTNPSTYEPLHEREHHLHVTCRTERNYGYAELANVTGSDDVRVTDWLISRVYPKGLGMEVSHPT